MAEDGWGAPRIHGELLKLGLDVSEITVSRYMPRRPVDPDKVKRWIAFLRNHKNAIAAMDFFAVPTASLRMLYVLFVTATRSRMFYYWTTTGCGRFSHGVVSPVPEPGVRCRQRQGFKHSVKAHR
jgi:hypothetical protein